MPLASAAGHNVEYEWIAGGEPTMVFLHEGLGSIRQWRDFPLQLAKRSGCRALVYNRYGYGGSDVLAGPRVGVRFMHRDEALGALPIDFRTRSQLLRLAGFDLSANPAKGGVRKVGPPCR